MHSLEPAFLEALTFRPDAVATLRRLGEFRGRQALHTRQRPEVLDVLRQVAAVESVESSNRLEGITATHARIEGLVRHDETPQDRSEQEITGDPPGFVGHQV